MINKRTAIILIVAIVLIVGFEAIMSLNKVENSESIASNAQVTLTVDGKTVDLEGVPVTYEYDAGSAPITSKLGKMQEKGYKADHNNEATFAKCVEGRNSYVLAIPKDVVPGFDKDITVNFGYNSNKSDFNSYALIIDLKTGADATLQADVTQTLYYPDENRNPLEKEEKVAKVLTQEDATITCIEP